METFEQEKQEASEIAKGENGFTLADKMAFVEWLCDSVQRLAELKELYRIYWTNYNIY